MKTLLRMVLIGLVPVALVVAQTHKPAARTPSTATSGATSGETSGSTSAAPAAATSPAPSAGTSAAPRVAAATATAEAWVQKNLPGWPPKTIALAVELVKKYGPPTEATFRQLTWLHNGPWKRTVLLKEGVNHNFPKAHQDVLEQTVDYRVPLEKVGDLLKYNGSVVVDRTRGELSAHCDSEKQNTITLNIADDIVKGERNVEQALAYHAQIIVGMRDGDPETYPQKLRFKPPTAAAPSADPGDEAPLLVHLGD